MTGKTHIIAGLAAGEAAQFFSDMFPNNPFFLGACIIGAIIPDICHTGSKIGRKLPLLSHIIRLLFGHRTVTHSLLFMIALGAVLSFFSVPTGIRSGLLIGIASHLLLDAATTRGIAFLWPIKLKVRLPLYTRTGGSVEHVFMILITLATLYMGYTMYLS